ncbi:MAG TPA: GTP-binding protein [Methanomicrobiales archaeon]|jgi:small GTP-binding protein|nr:GTP-binding protein [Methanomicrobiales archaeon]
MGVAGQKVKIVVFGAYNAGKSSFIRALDPFSRHIEAENEDGSTTVAMDFGRIRIGECSVFLFGTPGQERFEFARKILSRGMDGAVVVVDSTRDLDDITLALFQWLKARGIPVAVMANKCDCADALPEQVRAQVTFFPVHVISARTGMNVEPSLRAFLKDILSAKVPIP